MATNLKRARDNHWSSSMSSPMWKFTLLSGEYTPTFISRATVKFRCGAGVNSSTLVSDEIVEYVVLSGTLNVNGVDLQNGDYASVEPGVEVVLSSAVGMECICVMHGNVLHAGEIFRQIGNASLTDNDAKKLLKLPWIDHLRRHTSTSDVGSLCDAIKDSPSESVRELCINIARNLNSTELNDAVRRVFKSPHNLAMRISTLLFLASKGDIGPDEWAEQLRVLAAKQEEVIEVVSNFYAVNSLSALKNIIDQRIASGNYEYNYPLYNFLLTAIEQKS
jgi:hypothetical protein